MDVIPGSVKVLFNGIDEKIWLDVYFEVTNMHKLQTQLTIWDKETKTDYLTHLMEGISNSPAVKSLEKNGLVGLGQEIAKKVKRIILPWHVSHDYKLFFMDTNNLSEELRRKISADKTYRIAYEINSIERKLWHNRFGDGDTIYTTPASTQDRFDISDGMILSFRSAFLGTEDIDSYVTFKDEPKRFAELEKYKKELDQLVEA